MNDIIFNKRFQAVDYANGHGMIVEETEDGKWRCVYPPIPDPTKEQLYEEMYKKKCEYAYEGFVLVKDGIDYLIDSDGDSITMWQATKTSFDLDTQKTQEYWKSYVDGVPTSVLLTKDQFLNLYKFGFNMIAQSFMYESYFNNQILQMTQEQLQNKQFISNFRETVDNTFSQIVKRYELIDNFSEETEYSFRDYVVQKNSNVTLEEEDVIYNLTVKGIVTMEGGKVNKLTIKDGGKFIYHNGVVEDIVVQQGGIVMKGDKNISFNEQKTFDSINEIL